MVPGLIWLGVHLYQRHQANKVVHVDHVDRVLGRDSRVVLHQEVPDASPMKRNETLDFMSLDIAKILNTPKNQVSSQQKWRLWVFVSFLTKAPPEFRDQNLVILNDAIRKIVDTLPNRISPKTLGNLYFLEDFLMKKYENHEVLWDAHSKVFNAIRELQPPTVHWRPEENANLADRVLGHVQS